MTNAERSDSLDRIALDCEALRARLVRLAKALLIAEDTRARILIRAAGDSHNEAEVDTFVHDAERARECADTAAVVVARFERLDPRLNSTHGRPGGPIGYSAERVL